MNLNRTPLASAVALVLMGFAYATPARAADSTPTATAPAADATAADATAADAAQADPAATPAAKPADDVKTIDQVVVVGIRASLEKSLSIKRDAKSHVEVITAEDIGKMPDKNVADSLMRVPGVTTSSASANEGGFDENDRVSMRGTNPSLTQTLINGHQVSSGDWFVLNQSGTVGRSVSYTLLPSELVGRVIVHKTSEASLVEGGVAGSVDIQTRKPLEFSQSVTGEASIGGVFAVQPDKTDPQLSALFNWKNDSNTVGIMVQGFSEQRHLRRDGVEVLGYAQIKPGSAIATAHPDLANVWYPSLVGSALFEQERKRTGGLIEIELQPNDAWNLDLTAFSSKMEASNYNRNYMMWGARFINEGAGQSPDAGYVVRNGTLVSAHFTGVPGTQYGIYDQISRPDAGSDSSFVNLDATWHATDALTFSGKFGTTNGHGKTPTQDVAEWDTGKGTGAAYSFNGIDSAPDFNLGSEITNTPVNASLDWIFGLQNINVKDKEHWGQLDGVYDFGQGVMSHLRFGVRWSEHDRSLDHVIAQGPFGSAFNPANWPSGYQNYPSNFGNGLGDGFPSDVWYYTPEQLAAFDAANTNRDPTLRHYYPAEYALKEKNTAEYVQLDFEGAKWSGNVGLRVVQTKEHVVSNVDAPPSAPGAIVGSLFGAYVPLAFDNSYNDILPSANLKFDLNDETVLRFAASKTMTRADYSALAGNFSLTPPAVHGGLGSGTSSNPDLKPVRSTNFDVSLEWYFAPEALLSATAFYMDLTNYIGFGHITKTYMNFQPPSPPTGELVDYVLSAPINSSGKVKGFELAYQQPLFDNFGVNLNYTYADGEEKGGGPLIGTSKNTYNVGGYYETDRFNARLSYSYRSDFYSGLDRSTAFSQAATGNLSASLGYKFNDHVSVTFDALNLNNPTLRYFALNKDQPRSIYQSGRQYYLNLRLKL
jgi:iron complex outermembrane receptor protein